MKLTRNDLKGTGKVFCFQLKQLLSNKANIISIAITFVILLLSAPAISLFSGNLDLNGSPNTPEPFAPEVDIILPSKVYVLNETGLNITLPTEENYAFAEFTSDQYSANVKEGEAFLHLYINESGFLSKAYYPDGDEEFVALIGIDLIETARASLNTGKTDILNSYVWTESMTLSDFAETEDGSANDGEAFTMDNYFLQLIYSVVVMLVSMYAVAYIVQSVIEEKSSKLIELLLISIKPLALILGKILAVMVFVVFTFAVNAFAVVLSTKISNLMGSEVGFLELLETFGMSFGEMNLNPATVAVALISLVFGYLTYSLISGLCASGCSEPEDAQAANSTSIMIIMLCYMIALVTSSINTAEVNVITSIFPFISIFCAPVQYMAGNIEFYVLLISWVLQGAVIFLLAYMCAKVYKDLIIYKGKRLSFIDIIKMTVSKKGRVGK